MSVVPSHEIGRAAWRERGGRDGEGGGGGGGEGRGGRG